MNEDVMANRNSLLNEMENQKDISTEEIVINHLGLLSLK